MKVGSRAHSNRLQKGSLFSCNWTHSLITFAASSIEAAQVRNSCLQLAPHTFGVSKIDIVIAILTAEILHEHVWAAVERRLLPGCCPGGWSAFVWTKNLLTSLYWDRWKFNATVPWNFVQRALYTTFQPARTVLDHHQHCSLPLLQGLSSTDILVLEIKLVKN